MGRPFLALGYQEEISGIHIMERNAFIVASYYLGDEGKHWRTHIKHSLSPMENVIREWYSERISKIAEVPF